jgi:RNA polymerase sigma-70 factor, ECF subfamily
VSSDDQRLIAECLQGNTAAFGVLVRRYQERLYNSGDSLFFTWLYRIAVNTAISLKRKRRVMVRMETGCNGEKTMEPADNSVESQPGHALEQAEQGTRVHQALSQLSPEHRAVLVMKDMEGQKYETMAEILQVPIGTIRSRLHRARLELRELLEKSEKDG